MKLCEYRDNLLNLMSVPTVKEIDNVLLHSLSYAIFSPDFEVNNPAGLVIFLKMTTKSLTVVPAKKKRRPVYLYLDLSPYYLTNIERRALYISYIYFEEHTYYKYMAVMFG